MLFKDVDGNNLLTFRHDGWVFVSKFFDTHGVNWKDVVVENNEVANYITNFKTTYDLPAVYDKTGFMEPAIFVKICKATVPGFLDAYQKSIDIFMQQEKDLR